MDDIELREKIHAQIEEVNRGAPIPTVSSSDMKQFWDATRRMNVDMPPRPNVQIGMVSWLHTVLKSLIAPNSAFQYLCVTKCSHFW